MEIKNNKLTEFFHYCFCLSGLEKCPYQTNKKSIWYSLFFWFKWSRLRSVFSLSFTQYFVCLFVPNPLLKSIPCEILEILFIHWIRPQNEKKKSIFSLTETIKKVPKQSNVKMWRKLAHKWFLQTRKIMANKKKTSK